MSKKVLSVFGTRPEAIKMAPVVKELESREGVKSVVCVTAQHRGMLDQVLEVFKIQPDYDLDIMKPGQTLAYITSAVLQKLEEIIIKEKPDVVLVHGDTTTAMAAALASLVIRQGMPNFFVTISARGMGVGQGRFGAWSIRPV